MNENIYLQLKDYRLDHGLFNGSLKLASQDFKEFCIIIVKVFKASIESVESDHPRCKHVYLLNNLNFISKFDNKLCSMHLEIVAKIFINLLVKNRMRDLNDLPLIDGKIVNNSVRKFKNK